MSQLSSYIHKVDKIIIAQDSLKRFLNKISPGAYTSLTKVDFRALDKLQVKPIGVYGSKDEIVRFLASVAVIDDAMYAAAQHMIQLLSLTSRQFGQVDRFPGNKIQKTSSPLWPIHLPRFGACRRSGKDVCHLLARRVDVGRRCFTTCVQKSRHLHEVMSPWNEVYKRSLTLNLSDSSLRFVIKSRP